MEKKLNAISFHYLIPPFYFTERQRLKGFLLKALKREGRKVEAINYIFCDDAFLLEMNKQYLKHDTLTDIITFELSPKGQPIVADIYISVERVKENAISFGATLKSELHRVIFHGALHLAGYKDKSAADASAMRAMEEVWLRRYFVSRDTVSR